MKKVIPFSTTIIIVLIFATLTILLLIREYESFLEIFWEKFPLPIKSAETVIITTDKTEYEQGEIIKITVKNNLDKSICFESCNSYHIEKKNSDWEWTIFLLCEENFISECIKSQEIKTFEQETTGYESALGPDNFYRVAVPICIDCEYLKNNYQYRIDETIYSKEFTIK